ncbi:c-type cytochrome [Formosa sp. 3Alg 14/1]|uniref:c-type cytochrome n=1 Tax=Formosa sp. 3Alg 14/1 TaxID=3382190 RepID=UPI0039BE2986
MKNFIGCVALAIVLVSCNGTKKSDIKYAEVEEVEPQAHPGKKLMETLCYSCHGLSETENNRIGPPMIAIKKRYLNGNMSKEAFIESMQVWIKNPNENNVKMYGAVNQFGLMPKLAFPETSIAQIAEYMYDFKIEQPDWFEAHYQQQSGQRRNMNSKQFPNQK